MNLKKIKSKVFKFIPSNLKTLIKYQISLGIARGSVNFIKILIKDNKKGPPYSLTTKRNNKIYVRPMTSDSAVFTQIFVLNDVRLNELKIKTIIDLGANIGATVVYYKETYPDAKIIAIEPDKTNFELLRKNTQNFKEVYLLNSAIWNKKTNLNLINKLDKWSIQVKENKKGEIKSTTIPEIIKKFKLKNVDLLKIDIEGSEKELFEKNISWLSKIKIILVEIHENMKPGCVYSINNATKDKFIEKRNQGEKILLLNKKFQIKQL